VKNEHVRDLGKQKDQSNQGQEWRNSTVESGHHMGAGTKAAGVVDSNRNHDGSHRSAASGPRCSWRNPKVMEQERKEGIGHTTARMVTDQYDAFMDPANWPDEEKLGSPNTVYGWVVRGKPGASGLAGLSNEIVPAEKILLGQ
jgi:hypothetical protein